MTTIDTETMPPETTAVAVREAGGAVGALGVNEIMAQVHLIQQVMKKAMKEGEHYGCIPGTGTKKTLLQPGAQKLTMTFRLAPEYVIQETNLSGGHKEYRVVCTLKSIQTGAFLGQGVGCCSSMESKYRFRQGARKCPECGKEAIIKGKAEYGGGWLCFGKKGGCGAKWADGAAEIESQSIERIENDNPADTFNTVLKIAKKRAFVDATITATAASDIFTQDVGDDEGEPQDARPAVETPEAPKSSPQAKPEAKPTLKSEEPKADFYAKVLRGAKATDTQVEHALKYGKLCLAKFIKALTPEADVAATDIARGMEWISKAETIADLPVKHAPLNKPEFEQWMQDIEDHMAGKDPAALPKTKAVEVPRDEEAWRKFPVPFGRNAGKVLGDCDKAYLFGQWINYEVTTEDKNGRPKKPEWIKKDQAFRDALDAAGRHYEFTKREEQEDLGGHAMDAHDDDVPF